MEDFTVLTDSQIHNIEDRLRIAEAKLIKYEMLINIAIATMKTQNNEYLNETCALLKSRQQELINQQS